MFHVELRQFPHVARAFNLGEDQLRATVLGPWLRGEVIELGERRWAPERAQLTVYEGSELRQDEISMGRGWANAAKSGIDVTEQLLARTPAVAPACGGSSLADFKREVMAHIADGRIGLHQVLWLANAREPQRRVSERMALAEQAVWELLHERRLTMLATEPAHAGRDEPRPLARSDWQPTLLSWATWADPRAPSVLLERALEPHSG